MRGLCGRARDSLLLQTPESLARTSPVTQGSRSGGSVSNAGASH
jgi:hypothetical protein